jgi:hypothetical protein
MQLAEVFQAALDALASPVDDSDPTLPGISTWQLLEQELGCDLDPGRLARTWLEMFLAEVL